MTTHAELAEVFRVSLSTVRSWSSQGMPGERGAYSILDVERWRSARERTREAARRAPAAAAPEAGPDPLAEFARQKRELELRTMAAQARRAEETAISIDDVRDLLRSRMSGLRQGLLQLSSRALPRLREIQAEEGGWSNTRMRAVLEQEIAQLIEDYTAEVPA